MKTFLLIVLLAAQSFAAPGKAKKNTTKKEKPATIKSADSSKPAGKTLSFKAADGKVNFLAVGKPAMIKIMGESPGPRGDLKWLDDKLQGTLTIDIKNLTTKIELRDDHMKNKYLEMAKYPTADLIFKDYPLKLNEITAQSIEKSFSADLQLHGVTKPVVGTIKLTKNQDTIIGSATFNIKVTDYMDTLPSYAGIKVADDVQVTVDLKTIPQ